MNDIGQTLAEIRRRDSMYPNVELTAGAVADRRTLLNIIDQMQELPDNAIDRALDVWRQEADVAYSARINDYLLPGGGVDRDALRKGDEEAEQKNRDLMRRSIEAARDRNGNMS